MKNFWRKNIGKKHKKIIKNIVGKYKKRKDLNTTFIIYFKSKRGFSNREFKMSEFGLHVTIDASRCNKQKLISVPLVYDVLDNLPARIGMTKMTLPYVVKWLDKFSEGTPGISGFVMIAESHISIHTFPDQDYVFMDIFSCRNFDAEAAIDYLVDAFEAKNHKSNVVKRGLDFPKKVILSH